MSQHYQSTETAHVDRFVKDNLPKTEDLPDQIFPRPEVNYPNRLNCVNALLRDHCCNGNHGRIAIKSPHESWTYQELNDRASRVAETLTRDLGLVPGNRVMLHGYNSPMTVAVWFGILMAGGIVVATMPMLRSMEILKVCHKAKVDFIVSDVRMVDEIEKVSAQEKNIQVQYFNGLPDAKKTTDFERMMLGKTGSFNVIDTAADDPALLAFTSGTTGQPKGCIHFHRDILAISDAYAEPVLHPKNDDVFLGSPPIAFTFGLGASVVFPLRAGACSFLLEKSGPAELMDAVANHGVTALFTAPTAYQRMLALLDDYDLKGLRHCVSAGETLPASVWRQWHRKTGLAIAEGIGSTEMLHIFLSSPAPEARPGATGKALPDYEVRIVDENMDPVEDGNIGYLAVRGPTGCRYLDDDRQREYVKKGWNVTGDTYIRDKDGYFIYQARADDIIVSSGYKISGPEVEAVLLDHPAVEECAVVASPSPERGFNIKAFVVLAANNDRSEDMAEQLKAFVKDHLARYKCPHHMAFVNSLPKTGTGKLQRYVLRQQERDAEMMPSVAE